MDVRVKSIYETPGDDDGYRILVERFWPRGLTREDAAVDLWLKEIAPSEPLRKWFGKDTCRWDDFETKYFEELDNKLEQLSQIISEMQLRSVTLLYSSERLDCNVAVAIKEYLVLKKNRLLERLAA